MRRGPLLLLILIVLFLGHVCRVVSPVPPANSSMSKGGAANQWEWLVGDMAEKEEEEEEEFLMDSEINRRMLQGSSYPNYSTVKAIYSKHPAIPCGHNGQEPCFGAKNPPRKCKPRCDPHDYLHECHKLSGHDPWACLVIIFGNCY